MRSLFKFHHSLPFRIGGGIGCDRFCLFIAHYLFGLGMVKRRSLLPIHDSLSNFIILIGFNVSYNIINLFPKYFSLVIASLIR